MGGRAGHVRVCRRLVGVAMFGRGGSRCVAARPFSGRPTGGVSLLLARTRDEVCGGRPPGEGARGEGGRAGTSAGERVSGVRGGGLTGRPRRITLLRRTALLRPSVRRGVSVIGPDEVQVRGGRPPGEGARVDGGRAGTSAGERVSGVRGGGLTGRPRRITLLRRAALLRPAVRRGVIGPDEVQVRGGRPPGEEARVDSGRAGTSAGERVSAAEKREGWGG